ncbi:hypothetical protein [Paludibaculum fermentans]|uniref:Uncharacterized protein n=1 Tax=Paludibaculum fermentans TaxID=1473598 RepID=A0A7S7SJZ4_PALFE|nr:hypothetical protein [Paludibaculum fermentans]QOY87233.1 hypothetical protein IRI77_31420 [Paludibaculum fermentans]
MPGWNRRDALCLLGAAAWPIPTWAEEPWAAKKPAEWNEKELQHILSDSPWAKPVSVTVGSTMPSGGGGGRGRGGRGGGGGATPTADAGGAPTESGGGGRGVTNDGPVAAPSVIYTVRWMSALPMKMALVYSKMGAEAATSPQAKAFLEKEDQFYVINVSGPPRKNEAATERPRQLTPRVEAEIKEATSLSWKAHDKLQPLVVQVSQTNSFAFSFSFPRTHLIELEDKEVEFATKLGELSIKRKFKLKDMMFEGKLAL